MFILKGKEKQRYIKDYYEEESTYVFVKIYKHLRNWLPVDIAIDPEKQYIKFRHPLWIYFNNGYGDTLNWVPLIISDNVSDCYIPISGITLNITYNDFKKVKQFCADYYQFLKAYADEQITGKELYNFIAIGANLLECSLYDKNMMSLNEMAHITKNELLLPRDLYIDNEASYLKGKHGPRVKFQSADGNDNKRLWPSIDFKPTMDVNTALEELTLHYRNDKQIKGISQSTINHIKLWILNNIKLLWKVANKQMDINDFKEQMIKVDKHGKIIYKPATTLNSYAPVFTDVNGFTIIKNENNLFNILYNSKLISQKWFESVDKMLPYKNTFRTFAYTNGISGFLYADGHFERL